MNPEMQVSLLDRVAIVDCGDATGATLEAAHIDLTRRVAAALASGAVPWIVGGGNDQSYPNAVGLMTWAQGQPMTTVSAINIDAHLVRACPERAPELNGAP